MIVSALLTSVGINLGLSLLFFVLYSFLRKQPGNVKVYAPRRLAGADGRGHLQSENSGFNLEDLIPSAGWVRRALQLSEEELLQSCGLDAVVFNRIFTFSLRVVSFAAVLGLLVLLPVNYWGDHIQDIDFSDLPNKSLDLFSITNVKDGSERLWFHFSAAYLITGVTCYLLYAEFKHISEKRLAHFIASKPQPHYFTILVRDIPLHDGKSISDTVETFFKDYHPSTYLCHTVVRHTNKLQGLITDAESMYMRITHLKSRSHSSKTSDLVRQYSKKMEDLEDNVRLEQSDISLRGEELPAAFVSFKTRYGAAEVLHIQQSIKPTEWVTEGAPEPHDVYWPFFFTSFIQRWISKLVIFVASALLIAIFLVVVAFVQGLTYLEQLETLLPFLRKILSIAVVSQIATGYLPSLILYFVSSIVPGVMKLFSAMEGYISLSEIERSACYKMLLFTMWILFFANVLTGSATSQISIFFDPKSIPSRLAIVVPAQATFFIAYVVTSWTSLSWQLNQTTTLIFNLVSQLFSKSHDDFKIPSIPYHSEIPRVLLFGLLGLTYSLLAPLILPFLLIFFCIGYIVYRNQLMNVYLPKYETGGKFWPIVHNSTIFSLLLMQLIAIGMFGLKKLPLASSLMVPLPIVTLLFNYYCRKRFLPMFNVYSAETLIKKDREEQNDPAMEELFSNLESAYQDPALTPSLRSERSNDHNSPLLYSA